MKIAHCNANRRAETFILHAEDTNFKYLAVYKTVCPKCHRVLVNWQGVRHDGIFTALQSAKGKDINYWLNRIKTSIIAHSGPIVSEATLEMSKDVATTWERILNRENAKVKEGEG